VVAQALRVSPEEQELPVPRVHKAVQVRSLEASLLMEGREGPAPMVLMAAAAAAAADAVVQHSIIMAPVAVVVAVAA
jgi:hypothetical protein